MDKERDWRENGKAARSTRIRLEREIRAALSSLLSSFFLANDPPIEIDFHRQ